MTDIKQMSMSELIAEHNRLAEQLGVPSVDSFKSLSAARAAVLQLTTKVNTTMSNEDNTPPVEGMTPSTEQPAAATDASKYSTVGKRGPNQGISAYAKERILAGKTNAEILVEIKEKFQGAQTSASCIAFYRNALKKGGQGNPDAIRAKAQALLDQAAALEKAQAEAAAKAAEPVAA